MANMVVDFDAKLVYIAKNSRYLCYLAIMLICPLTSFSQNVPVPAADRAATHHEWPDQPYLPPQPGAQEISPAHGLKSTGFFTTQVNVDVNGNNIVDDAANEPSIAVDPTNPDKMVIGWRQFDNISSNFRQAGYGYSSNGGQSWTFPGVIDPLIFRSDPVLDFDTAGNFFYNSLTTVTGDYTCNVYKSVNGGATWDFGTEAHGGDKQWMTIDRTGGSGSGNIYSAWNSYYSSCTPGFFTRSANAGASYEDCVLVDGNPYWGTMEVGSDGALFIAGAGVNDGVTVVKSSNAKVPGSVILWDYSTYVDMDGYVTMQTPVNPVGLLGQVSIDVDRSGGPGQGNIYVLASVARISVADPADVMFAKSTDGGITFGPPKRINNDVSTDNYQWFGTMSVAPNGRIDAIWLDTRNDFPGSYLSALYYCYSSDQGETWSINKKLSDLFDPNVGYPQQEKMGDYFDMVSDDGGAHLAWANTLNGEQDVYYTHIIPSIVGIADKPASRKFSISASPNPFLNQTTIRYQIPDDCLVKVVICNIYGEQIRTLVDKNQPAGDYTVNFSDQDLPAGFYLCRVTAGEQMKIVRLVKVKS
ncbi:MAG: T9SS type A sorting domain-containing protein [Bacteroidetes bacterium]|nr:T9SS type A sorting domain-containing protein [Bacteroidota bacterium]